MLSGNISIPQSEWLKPLFPTWNAHKIKNNIDRFAMRERHSSHEPFHCICPN